MKLWKENRTDQEWELDNKEIAEKFVGSLYNIRGGNIARQLVNFISAREGLHSSWDWDKKKGSIEGSKDMLEILDLIESTLEELPAQTEHIY